jgi:hypothetical protein
MPFVEGGKCMCPLLSAFHPKGEENRLVSRAASLHTVLVPVGLNCVHFRRLKTLSF